MNDEELATPHIEPGHYEHYKGKRYEVLGTALHTETLEPVVMYKPLYQTNVSFWVRPYEMFTDKAEHDGRLIPRFRKVD